MNESSPAADWTRQILSGLAGIAIAAAGLVAWYWLKRHSLMNWLEISFGFMPLLIGVAVGCGIRRTGAQGTFGMAGFAVLVTMLAGLAGAALQHRLDLGHRLPVLARATYDETLAYAKVVIASTNEFQLRRSLTNSQVVVVGRIANQVETYRLKDFWRNRNFIHLHWVATRQLTSYGQGGTDRTIWEATRVVERGPFLDDVIRNESRNPISADDLVRIQGQEAPFLRKLLDGGIPREEFESSLEHTAFGEISWNMLIRHGLGVFVGLGTAVGALCAYKLVREAEEEEVV